MKVVRQRQVDPGGKSKAGFLSGTLSARVLQCFGWDAAASKLPISELVLDLSKLLECCGQDLSCRQNSWYLIKYSSINRSIDAAENQKVREVLS